VHLLGLPGEPDGVRADEFAGTVITLDDADVVLIRLEADGLTIELPLPSAVAIDLVLRVIGACGGWRSTATAHHPKHGALLRGCGGARGCEGGAVRVTCVLSRIPANRKGRRARSLVHLVL
jgi:hypothetical protein